MIATLLQSEIFGGKIYWDSLAITEAQRPNGFGNNVTRIIFRPSCAALALRWFIDCFSRSCDFSPSTGGFESRECVEATRVSLCLACRSNFVLLSHVVCRSEKFLALRNFFISSLRRLPPLIYDFFFAGNGVQLRSIMRFSCAKFNCSCGGRFHQSLFAVFKQASRAFVD